MKLNSLLAAGALVLVSNAFVFRHVASNRSGQPESQLTLTDRELNYWRQSDDSGVHLTLQISQHHDLRPTFLSAAKLRELGFDTSYPPSGKDAWQHYANMGARSAYIAIELDGRSFEEYKDRRREQSLQWKQKPEDVERDLAQASRLVPIDAARTKEDLRSRYPDRTRILILPAVVRIQVDSSPKDPALKGFMTEWPSQIHIPKPFSDGMRDLDLSYRPNQPRFEVDLAYGRNLEPWVTAVRVNSSQAKP
jgi:hypothetical protein